MPILAFLIGNWKWVVPAVALGLMLGAIGIQTWRLERCNKGFAEYKVLAEAREKALGDTISIQNRAVAALEEESRNRIAKAQKGLQEASRAAQGARNEAARLRALASQKQPSEALECPAGAAVGEIRRGLGNSVPDVRR